jgi:hypothetical protein
MITTEQAIIVGSPADSDGSDERDLEASSTPYSSLSSEAGRRASDQSDKGRYIKEESSSKELQVARKFVPCIDTMGLGCADPFQTLPDMAGGDTEGLTHHCMYSPMILPCHHIFLLVRYALTLPGHTVFVNTTTPPGPRKRWFPSSIGDPALFHGIMHISASHLAASRRSRPSAAYFQHRGEVIRLVNKRITHDQDATSDGTISAIACLLISDVCLFAARTH